MVTGAAGSCHPIESTMPIDSPKPLGAISPAPSRLAAFFRDVYVFDWDKLTFRADLILVLPVALCLAIGLAAGHPGAALITAGGAATIGFGAKQQIGESRLLPMILASLGIAFSTFLGMIAGHTNAVLVPLAGLWGFGYG
jgi:hypothetical protein